MPIRYDAENDTLRIPLRPELYKAHELEGGDWSVVVDEAGRLVRVTIANASRFVGQADSLSRVCLVRNRLSS